MRAGTGSIENAAAPRPWLPDQAYPYVIIEQRLPEVVREFGANLGMPVAISDKVEGVVRGRWPISTAAEFLGRLEATFRLQSYYDGRVLHVTSAEEARSEMLRLNGIPFAELENEMDDLGLLDRNYSLRPAPNGRTALAYGPPRYLELVKQTILVLSEQEPEQRPRPARATQIIRGYTESR
jgi:type II secretory pathway component GspD/PulD (secretin)